MQRVDGPDKSYGDRISLDAVKADAYRKAKQKQGEVGLLALHETQPLTLCRRLVHLVGKNNQSKPTPFLLRVRMLWPIVDDYCHNDKRSVYLPQQEFRRKRS